MPNVKFVLKPRGGYAEVGDVQGEGRLITRETKILEKMVELPYEAIPRVGDYIIQKRIFDPDFTGTALSDNFFPDIERELKVRKVSSRWYAKTRTFDYTVELQELRD